MICACYIRADCARVVDDVSSSAGRGTGLARSAAEGTDMPQRSLAGRVKILEESVGSLEELPERTAGIESQLLQFREENRAEHSAIRAEIRAGDEETRRVAQALRDDLLAKLTEQIRVGDEETRRFAQTLHDDLLAKLTEQIRVGDEETRRFAQTLHDDLLANLTEQIRVGDEETRRLAHALHDEVIAKLGEQIRGGDEESRRFMRILHEDLVERITLLGEARGRTRKRR
jgi:hypothetical protein